MPNKYGPVMQRKPGDDPRRQCWRTPKKLFQDLHGIFNFSIDACADAQNALLPRYWSEERDCRLQDWSKERVFCNPPFRGASAILAKAPTALTACFLLPVVCITTKYFGRYPPRILALPNHRIVFDPPDGSMGDSRPTLETAILVYGECSPSQKSALGALNMVVAEVAQDDARLRRLLKYIGEHGTVNRGDLVARFHRVPLADLDRCLKTLMANQQIAPVTGPLGGKGYRCLPHR